MKTMRERRFEKGFTILEILVVVAIVGILSAIAIVNYIAALNRAKQKRTVADIRTVATAWESRASEVARYNAAGFTFPDTSLPYDSLRTLLVPTYAQTMPRLDGWNHPLDFAIDSGTPASEYAVRSPGRDGLYETTYVAGATNRFDCDIVYSGGSFVVYPDVIQEGR